MKRGPRLDKTQFNKRSNAIIDALRTPSGGLPPDHQIYTILDNAGIIDKIRPYILGAELPVDKHTSKAVKEKVATHHGIEQDHPIDILTPEQQFKQQQRKLYDRAFHGDMQAMKLWFEMFGEPQMQENAFNVNINITDYRISDRSLVQIAEQADTEIVVKILRGIERRLVMAEAQSEYRIAMKNALVAYKEWSEIEYAVKDA